MAGVLLAQAARAEPAADVRVALFTSICVDNRTSFKAAHETALRSGWSSVKPTDDLKVSRLLDASRDTDMYAALGVDPATTDLTRYDMLEADVEDRAVYLSLMEFEAADETIVICRLWDYGRAGPIEPEIMIDWLGEPDETNTPTIWLQAWYDPPSLSGVVAVEHVFVSEDFNWSVGLSLLSLYLVWRG